MFWLEMSRDEDHGGGDWGFTKCLWSPAYKTDGSKWAFWESVLQVKTDDVILHLRGLGKKAAFVGFSIADSNAFETGDKPPSAGQWNYATSFYRVPLRDFISFDTPILLNKIFENYNDELRYYFTENKNLPKHKKRRIFYVIQAGRIQCLNGAYLSEVDEELTQILLGGKSLDGAPDIFKGSSNIPTEAKTNEQVKELKVRVGQRSFSEKVRANYNHCCCFPECEIAENSFLIGAHIARWADSPEIRGQISNGLCLCLMHDKAFEQGLFTLTEDYRIFVNAKRLGAGTWGANHIQPYHGMPIKIGLILPSDDAILLHWQRLNLCPDFEN